VVAPLRISAPVAIVSTIYDNAHLVYGSQDGQVDGKVTVDVGSQPVFIEVDRVNEKVNYRLRRKPPFMALCRAFFDPRYSSK
jgi:hypothetical protein